MPTLAKIMGLVSIPTVTPFYPGTEDVNFDAMEQLIDFAIRNKFADSIILTGTTAEFHALSDDERIQIWKVAKQAIADRVPMVAGTGAASTRAALRLCAEAEKLGVDAIMVVAPFYSKPTQAGIENHYRRIASAVTTPILLYNIPLFTGVNIDPDTFVRLTSLPNVKGIKEEAGIAPTQATRFAMLAPSDFDIYCGDDTMVLQVLPQRGVGVVSGGAQIVGGHMQKMIAAYFNGDNRTASEIYFKMAPFFEALNQNGRINPIPILRGAIEMATGIPVGPPRSPLAPATKEELAVVRKTLQSLEVVEAVAV